MRKKKKMCIVTLALNITFQIILKTEILDSLLLTIIIDNGSHELVFLQHREELQRFSLAQDIAALQTV